jgi:protein SCO1/2
MNVVMVLMVLLPAVAGAADPQDAILREIGVDERLGASIPADLVFTEASGKRVRLGDYLGAGPVVLTLNYYRCPMLCPLTFRSLAATMGAVSGLSPAKDYRVVTVSIDTEEIPEIAAVKARETRAMVPGLDGAGDRWPFLYGDPENVRRLTDAVGYRYRKVGSDFAHPSATVILSPGGKVTRYLYGMEIPPRDLKLALIEAADGRIGASSAANALLMYCFQYDPAGRTYALYARNVMRAAGAATVLFLAALLLVLWRRHGGTGEVRRKDT